MIKLIRLLFAFLPLWSAAQPNVVGMTAKPQASGFVRDNLYLEYTVEQSDAVTNFVISAPPPTNTYFQAIEKQTGYTAITRQNGITRAGGWAAQIDINSGFPMDGRLRTELVYFPDITPFDRVIYGWSQYLPEDFNLTGTDWIQCLNIHAWEDRGPGEYDEFDAAKISPIGLYIRPDQNEYDLNYAWNAANPTPGWNDDHFYFGDVAADKGVWTDWVLEVTYDYNTVGSGHIKLWKNGVLVFERAGPVGYNDAHGPYAKWGLHTGGTKTNRIYFDEIRIGNGSATYNDVVPADGFVYNKKPLNLLNGKDSDQTIYSASQHNTNHGNGNSGNAGACAYIPTERRRNRFSAAA